MPSGVTSPSGDTIPTVSTPMYQQPDPGLLHRQQLGEPLPQDPQYQQQLYEYYQRQHQGPRPLPGLDDAPLNYTPHPASGGLRTQ